MNAGVRLRFGGFLISLAGRKGFTNDAPDWGVFALVSYQMNVGIAVRREGGGRTRRGRRGRAGRRSWRRRWRRRRAGRRRRAVRPARAPGARWHRVRGPAAPEPVRVDRARAGPVPVAARARVARARAGAGGPGRAGRGWTRRRRTGRGGPGQASRRIPPAALPPSLRSALRGHQLPVRPVRPHRRGEGDPRRAGPGPEGEPAVRRHDRGTRRRARDASSTTWRSASSGPRPPRPTWSRSVSTRAASTPPPMASSSRSMPATTSWRGPSTAALTSS